MKFLRVDARKLPLPSEAFDFLISVNVLEHLHPRDMVFHLNEVRRLLCTKGRYFCSTPSRYMDEEKGLHLKLYTDEELARIFREYGFQIRTTSLLPHPFPVIGVIPIEIKARLESIFKKFRIPRFL